MEGSTWYIYGHRLSSLMSKVATFGALECVFGTVKLITRHTTSVCMTVWLSELIGLIVLKAARSTTVFGHLVYTVVLLNGQKFQWEWTLLMMVLVAAREYSTLLSSWQTTYSTLHTQGIPLQSHCQLCQSPFSERLQLYRSYRQHWNMSPFRH